MAKDKSSNYYVIIQIILISTEYNSIQYNIYFRLRFRLVNSNNAYLWLKNRIVFAYEMHIN